MKSTFLSPLILAVSAVLLVGFHSLSASWTPPTATPPGDNVAPVVNTGSTTQNKAGNFMANIVAAATSTWSPRYCDELGNNCWSPGTSSGPGGWESISLTGATPFDRSCEYRAVINEPSFSLYYGNRPFFYFSGVSTSSITSVAHSGVVSHINSNSKSTWRVNGNPVSGITVELIEKRCGGAVAGAVSKGAIETMRGMTTSFLPPPPPGLSEWPDYLICDIHATQKHYFMPFSRIFIVGTDQVVSYSPDGSGAGGYSVRSNGTYYSRAAVMANCGPDSTGSDIVSICNAGYCGYY